MKDVNYQFKVKDGSLSLLLEDDHMKITFTADEQRVENIKLVLKSLGEGMVDALSTIKPQLEAFAEKAGFKVGGASAKTEQAPETATSPEEAHVVYVLQEPRTYRPSWIVRSEDIEKTKKGWAKFNGKSFHYVEITSPTLQGENLEKVWEAFNKFEGDPEPIS